MSSFLALGVATACALVLANCGGRDADQTEPLVTADVSGMTIGDVSYHLPPEATLLVQQPAIGPEDAPLYDSSQQTSSRWIVLVGCSDREQVDDSGSVEVSVISQDDFDESIRAQLDSGDLADTITCDGREYRSTP